ncbi:hypothetical protein VCSRO193_3320 [Vibrio cholerae]|nr:hypothetical protein VCSRO193_3320 [Vibrio cholerae]
MARPKSYTDQDLIQIVQEILSQGDEVSTWRIKEQLGRGKLSTIKRDLERLINSGEIDTTRKEQNTATTENPVIASYELPIEVQNLLAQSEQDICKIIQRITTSLNCQVHQHYENLMNAAYFGAFRSVISGLSDHPFRFKPITDSAIIRSLLA